jgi:hypothetical protein
MKQRKITSWVGLARHIGVGRRSLLDWRKRPGAPAEPDLAAWEEFIQDCGLGIASTRLSPEREKLLQENLRKKNHLLALQIAEKENRMVSTEAINEFLGRVATTQRAVFYGMLENDLPPRLAGKTAPEMSIIGRQTADKLCDIFSTELDQWLSMLPPVKPAKPGAAGHP